MNLILFGHADHHRTSSDIPNDVIDDIDMDIDIPPDDERTRHILDHLKKTSGDEVSIGIVDPRGDRGGRGGGGGYRCRASIRTMPNGGVRLVRDPRAVIRDPPTMPTLTLVLAMPFPSRMRYLWSVISSFEYVTRVILVPSSLSDPEYMKSTALNPRVYGPLIEGGMSQGGRTRPVRVEICPMNEIISRTWMERYGLVRGGGGGEGGGMMEGADDDDDDDDGTARIFLDCGDEDAVPPPARDVVLRHCGKRDRIVSASSSPDAISHPPSAIMAVGPERGWTDDEARVFVKDCGFRPATLGGSILRVDAAVVTGLGIVSAALDECHRNRGEGRTSGGGGERRESDGGARRESETDKRGAMTMARNHRRFE
ncbi:hypothetical protein ACHAXA_005110 [Cyclostephanos tholiformis]|uniref:16S rRNA (uracil(1498)-N(3))-methyltransferase n=1 Tax=Cyclostephanos tholiformis TaxID=382380 RepID=A0ABD3RXB2_9STRA